MRVGGLVSNGRFLMLYFDQAELFLNSYEKSDFLVYMDLLYRYNNYRAYGKQDKIGNISAIAKRLNLRRKTVYKSIKRLLENNIIEVENEFLPFRICKFKCNGFINWKNCDVRKRHAIFELYKEKGIETN
jgi:hypothetical protein